MTHLIICCRWHCRLAASLLLTLLAACANYEFRVNERVVYTPAPLFNDFTVVDSALQDCLLQTIQDQKVVRAQDLTELQCSHAGITSVEGLAIFTALEWLSLAHNKLADISPLGPLTNLQIIDLGHNQLTDISVLNFLPRLTRVTLTGNQQLNCQHSRTLAARNDFKIVLPKRCTATD